MASFNTGTSAVTAALVQATGTQITIPAGVATNDQMLIMAASFTVSANTQTALSLAATSGNTWLTVGTLQNSGITGGAFLVTQLWKRVATGTDPSDTITIKSVGTVGGSNQYWIPVVMGAWTGFPGGVDVFAANAGNSAGATFTEPSATTGIANDWSVNLAGLAVSSSGGISGHPGTQRETAGSAGINAIASDSNGSVGGSGTGIGGGTYTGAFSGIWWGSYIVGLATQLPATGSGALLAGWPA